MLESVGRQLRGYTDPSTCSISTDNIMFYYWNKSTECIIYIYIYIYIYMKIQLSSDMH